MSSCARELDFFGVQENAVVLIQLSINVFPKTILEFPTSDAQSKPHLKPNSDNVVIIYSMNHFYICEKKETG